MLKRKADTNQVATVIGPGAVFDGNIKASGMVRVDGKLNGDLTSDGNIVIGETGEVTAKVTGRNVTVAGIVHGNITANERLLLLPTARLYGDARIAKIIVEEGAKFTGNIEMIANSSGNQKGSTEKTKLFEVTNELSQPKVQQK